MFHLKIFFILEKWFPKKIGGQNKFSQQHESVSRSTPPQCCWENVKKCQNFTYGYFDKNSKNTIINRETVFTKIFEKTRTYGDFDENFQKLAGRLRVKRSGIVPHGMTSHAELISHFPLFLDFSLADILHNLT